MTMPFYWQKKRHIVAALRLTVTMLMPWQATRRKGGAKLILKRLEPLFPRIIGRLQKVLQKHSEEWFSDDRIEPGTPPHAEVVVAMATSVGEIADIVTTRSRHPATNPMLGSKVLSFFYPDFFPIWDTAWVSKALVTPLEKSRPQGEAAKTRHKLSSAAAGRYGKCLDLMIRDAWDTSRAEYRELEAYCIRLCERDGYSGARRILREELYSLPVLFEACLLGRAAREGEL
jgi:hypothetical protein